MQLRSHSRGLQQAIAAFSICFALSEMPRAAAMDAVGDELVLVRLTIPTNYGSSEADLKAVQKIMNVLPPRIVTSNDPPSKLISEKFNFGQKDNNDAYQAFLEKTLKLNGASDARRFPSGRVLAPQAPPRSWDNFNAALSRNKIPRLSSLLPGDLTTFPLHGAGKTTRLAYRESAKVTLGTNQASPHTNLFAWVPKSRVEANIDLFSDPKRASVIGQDMLVKPALSCVTKTSDQIASVMNQDQKASIEEILNRAIRPVTIMVFDKGWPGATEFENSADSLREMSSKVRERWMLPAGRFPSKAEIKKLARTIRADDHTSVIVKALNEFTTLDSGGIVRIIYLPYDPELPASRAILTDLLDILKWSEALGDSFGLEDAGTIPDLADWRKKIREQTESTLDRIVEQNRILTQAGGDLSQKYTSWSVLKAAMLVLELYAQATQSVGFLNASWTTTSGPLSYSSGSRSMVIAAAGNDSIVVDEPGNRVYLAQRSLEHSDTLLVMNGDSTGGIGGSSCISEVKLGLANAITFDGRVGGSSGTSFAAPRVAWLLGLREVVRSGLPGDHWQSDVRLWVSKFRSNSGSVFERTWLSPEAVLKDIATQ